MCANADVKKHIFDDMIHVGKREGLCSFEQVKDIYVCWEPFSTENGLLTPTLKSKRLKLKERFASQLSQMSWARKQRQRLLASPPHFCGYGCVRKAYNGVHSQSV
ncbi:unnamed protein product [Toxocara canis]|uniref:Uncharacterized protein n=1 Tax=Toxocara canis TaxID=6265 RepID=A0A3P7IK86_TOXCA|nr:unnamed protein product [Toxocara canis]